MTEEERKEWWYQQALNEPRGIIAAGRPLPVEKVRFAKGVKIEPEPTPFLRQFPTAPALTEEFPANGWQRSLQGLIDYENTYWEARRQVEVSKLAISIMYERPDSEEKPS